MSKDAYGRGKIKFLRWTDGRQGSGYKILYLWNWLFDLVLIRYPTNSYIHWHTDPVPKGLEHHRINITLKYAEKGGEFCLKPGITYDGGSPWGGVWPSYAQYHKRWMRFRPDKDEHSVHKIEKGERWVFSIGWLKKEKANGK